MNSRKRKNNGVTIFGGATVILFAAVFFMSKIFGGDHAEDIAQKPEQTSVSAAENTGSTGNTDNAESEAEGDDVSVSGDVTDEDVTEPAVSEPAPDPDDADNLWAMFLVNSINPVSEEYCDGIETALVYESWREYYMDSRAAEYMKKMLEAAEADGHELIVMSAYRTVEYQQNNFDRSVQDRIDNRGMTYEEAYEDTLKEVQLPGYSEHNAGVSADIMSDECDVSMEDDVFKTTQAYAWLQEHAADYGFILRYPEGKEDITGIIYEPWHYRFVGVYYAKLLSDRGITLEEYFEEMNWVDSDGKAVYHTVG